MALSDVILWFVPIADIVGIFVAPPFRWLISTKGALAMAFTVYTIEVLLGIKFETISGAVIMVLRRMSRSLLKA
jgi:hypothetical protein